MLGIIILNYNGALSTISCVESVVRYNTYPSKYIIVDNASNDDSVYQLSQHFKNLYGREFALFSGQTILPRFTLIVSEENGGYALGNNLGLKCIEMDEDIEFVMILNNDVLFTDDIVPTLIKKSTEKDDAGLVSPLLFTKDCKSIDYNCARKCPSNYSIIHTFLLQYRDICKSITKRRNACKMILNDPELLKKDIFPIELPSGSCMLIKKAIFKEIGWFDPNTFLYYEENILYKKLKTIGKTNYLIPSVSCIHLGAQSTSQNSVAFLKRVEAESAEYYLNNYGNLSFMEAIIKIIAFRSFNFRAVLAKYYRELVR